MFEIDEATARQIWAENELAFESQAWFELEARFPVGQSVRVISDKFTVAHRKGQLGTVVELKGGNDCPICVQFGQLRPDFIWFKESELEPVREANEEQHPQPNQ